MYFRYNVVYIFRNIHLEHYFNLSLIVLKTPHNKQIKLSVWLFYILGKFMNLYTKNTNNAWH